MFQVLALCQSKWWSFRNSLLWSICLYLSNQLRYHRRKINIFIQTEIAWKIMHANLVKVYIFLKLNKHWFNFIIFAIDENGSLLFHAETFYEISLFDDVFWSARLFVSERDLHIMSWKKMSGICFFLLWYLNRTKLPCNTPFWGSATVSLET